MNCKTCYTLCNKISDCLETLSIMTTEEDETLKVFIIDKFGHKYSQEVESQSNGLVVLDLTDEDIFPVALLNPYAGEFQLYIEKNDVIIPFNVEGVEYDCLRFSVEHASPAVSNYLIDVYNTTNTLDYN